MMMTAIAISPMMRNVLSVATILPTAVKATDMARIAPRIVPMIRRMSPVCARGVAAGRRQQRRAGQAVPERAGPVTAITGRAFGGRYRAPSPRRGGQGELLKSRSCQAPHSSPPGALFAAAGAWCARDWYRTSGPGAAAGLSALYLAAMGGSHPLAKRIGAWPSVAAVTAVTAAAAELVTRTAAR
jgi:hypothetical protein